MCKTATSQFYILEAGTKELGDEGEEIAARHLESKGFCIVERKFRSKVGEIDLIATCGRLLVFCEVKSRRCLVYGAPVEAIDKTKIRHIRRVASWYLTQKMRIKVLYDDFDIRFDVIEVVFVSKAEGEDVVIDHIENAF
jgi:putative endonuclease